MAHTCFIPINSINGVCLSLFQVSLFLVDNYNPGYGTSNFAVCSGTIVHSLYVLTTADCVHSHILAYNLT